VNTTEGCKAANRELRAEGRLAGSTEIDLWHFVAGHFAHIPYPHTHIKATIGGLADFQ
jgi:hypothetical protein